MTIRPAEARDVAAIAALVNAAYRGAGAQAGWAHEAELLEGQRTDETMVRGLVEGTPGAILLLADADAVLLGCVAVAPTARAAVWSLGMLAVDPRRQAGGAGRELIAAAEAFAGARGARRMEMTVIGLRTALIAYYERQGYRQTGASLPFPYGDERFGRPLRDDLSFVVLDRALT